MGCPDNSNENDISSSTSSRSEDNVDPNKSRGRGTLRSRGRGSSVVSQDLISLDALVTIWAAVVLALAFVAASTAAAQFTPDNGMSFNQRLVRRNFLRFGKRSGSPPAASGDVGEGEQFEASVMSGQHPHKSNTRSFLRFGKRAADYLRFGKRSADYLRFGKRAADYLRFGKRGADYLRFGKKADNFLRFGKSQDFLRFGKSLDKEAGPPIDQALIDPSDMSKSQPLADERDASNAESIDWDNRLLTLLSRLNQGGISDEDDDLKENNYQAPAVNNMIRHQQEQLFNKIAEKKANDFLRFGKKR